MFGRIGPMELILIFSIALIIFGPKKLPEIGKAIGSAIQNFKRHSNSLTEGLESDTSSTSQPAAASSPPTESGKGTVEPEPETKPAPTSEPEKKEPQ